MPDQTHPSCAKLCKALRAKDIDLDATGSRDTNALIKLLRCQVKADSKHCSSVLEQYTRCHNSIMGSGVYKGQKHCGDELLALFACAINR